VLCYCALHDRNCVCLLYKCNVFLIILWLVIEPKIESFDRYLKLVTIGDMCV